MVVVRAHCLWLCQILRLFLVVACLCDQLTLTSAWQIVSKVFLFGPPVIAVEGLEEAADGFHRTRR